MTVSLKDSRARAGLARLLACAGPARGALLCLMLAMAFAPQAAVARPTDEASLHAAYLLNFVRYSRWPDPGPPARPYVIAVLGPLESVAAVRELARRAGKIEGRPIVVRPLSFNTAAPARDEAVRTLRREISGAQVVYVAASHRSWNSAVVAATAGRPVLTVGVGSRFVAAGGMFGLVEDHGRVVFTANSEVIRASPLNISARVLMLARATPAPGD